MAQESGHPLMGTAVADQPRCGAVEFALLPPIVLDRISTDWVLGPGNHLLPHYSIDKGLWDAVKS